MNNNKMSILIIGFDGYSDLWDDCINLIKKFWLDCPFELVFVNNELERNWDRVTVLHAGKDAEWSRKVQIGLEYCNSEYICLLLEDFLIGRTVITKSVLDLLSLMERRGFDYAKLVDMNNAAKDYNKSIEENKEIHYVRYCDDYGISLQPSIWRSGFLKELIGLDNYNAWIFEFNRVKESQPHNKNYRPNVVFDTRNILNVKHGVIQSKYLPGTIKYFKNIGIELNVQREIMKQSQYNRIRMISILKSIVPLSLRPFVKRELEKTGMKFVSTERNIK